MTQLMHRISTKVVLNITNIVLNIYMCIIYIYIIYFTRTTNKTALSFKTFLISSEITKNKTDKTFDYYISRPFRSKILFVKSTVPVVVIFPNRSTILLTVFLTASACMNYDRDPIHHRRNDICVS